MRIRKNAKLSSLFGLSSTSPAATSQSHVCQLNQSPWDVISFSHDSSPPMSSFHPDHHPFHQLEGNDSLTRNASLGNSPGASDSGIEMVVGDDYFHTRTWKQEEAPDGNRHDDDNDNGNDNDNYYEKDNAGGGHPGVSGMIRTGCCRKTNGKGWQCSREAKEGHYLCEHHLKSHQDTSNNIVSGGFESNELPASSIKKGGPGRRGRPPKKGPLSKSSEAKNSNQFYYYYSGFGPSWGRRRAVRSGNGGGGPEDYRVDEMGEESSGRSSGTPPPLAQMGGQGEIDCAMVYDMDDDDEEEEEEEEEGINEESSRGGRKRTRKPVKARSLKSLM